MKRVLVSGIIAALWLATSAHVGSPNVVFDGTAGPYPVRVIVRPPNVVPGLADVVVTVNAPDAERVSIRPVFWRTGVNGAPKGDDAKGVAGQTNVYTGQLWLMSRGAYSVYVTVAGARGTGTAIVPVTAFATARLGLSPALGAILVVLGTILFAGLVTIVRAAAGESVLPPGQPIDAPTKRRANRIALIATPLFVLLVLGGAKWWNAVDADYRRTMFRPPAVDVTLDGEGPPMLRLRVHDTAAFRAIVSPVVPDHGHMMHLFLVSDADPTFFAHLHPVETDSLVFETPMPAVDAGRVHLFGDLVFEDGRSLTVATTFTSPRVFISGKNSADGDDAIVWEQPVPLGDGARVAVGDNWMTWAGPSVIGAGKPVDLHFVIRDPTGGVRQIEPYMGMAGHAIVLRDDDSVFVHLHPMGTVAAAAQDVFRARDRGDTTRGGRVRGHVLAETHAMPVRLSGDVSFPYEFPKPGRYRIWVQIRQGESVSTAAFFAIVH